MPRLRSCIARKHMRQSHEVAASPSNPDNMMVVEIKLYVCTIAIPMVWNMHKVTQHKIYFYAFPLPQYVTSLFA